MPSGVIRIGSVQAGLQRNGRSDQDVGEVGSAEGRSRLPPDSRIDGDHLPVFRVSEVVRLRGVGVDSLYQQRASHLLDVSRVRHPRSQLVPGRLGMVVRSAVVPGILEQETGHPRRPRLMRHLRHDRDDHPVHADGWAASATSGPIPSHLHGVADERIAHHHHLAGLQFDIVDLKGRADDGGPDLILQKDDLAVRGRAYSHVQPRCHAHGHAGGPKSVTLRPYGAGTGLEARDRATISLADRNPSAT